VHIGHWTSGTAATGDDSRPRGGAARAGALLQLLDALTALDVGLALFDRAGALVHANAAWASRLGRPRAGDPSRGEVERAAQALCAAAAPTENADRPDPDGGRAERCVATPDGVMRLAAVCVGPELCAPDGGVMVALHAAPPDPLSEASLRERFGLSRQECRIAGLLVEGCSTSKIAHRVGISPHTVRRHTERVFAKLGARARAEVAIRVLRPESCPPRRARGE
jgi:DNA-binding CsgD family transcriptional regulator